MNNNDNKQQKIVTIKILDKSGHTTLEQAIDEAIRTAFTANLANGQQINVRTDEGIQPFELTATGMDDAEGFLNDMVRLHKVLSQYEDPVIYITGELVGGV